MAIEPVDILEQGHILLTEAITLRYTTLFIPLMLIAFVALFIGYISSNATFKMFGAALSSVMFFILGYAILGNQFGEMLQMAWLVILLAALGLIQAIYAVLIAIGILYSMFMSKQYGGMDAIPYESERWWKKLMVFKRKRDCTWQKTDSIVENLARTGVQKILSNVTNRTDAKSDNAFEPNLYNDGDGLDRLSYMRSKPLLFLLNTISCGKRFN